MNSEYLNDSYQKNKNAFHKYVDDIKRTSVWNLFNIINPTLVKNPYSSVFPLNFFLQKEQKYNKFFMYLKNIIFFYIKNLYLFISYISQFIIFKVYYKKSRRRNIETVFDVFALVDNINKDNVFKENYLANVYDVFDELQNPYTILLRPYGISKNPFKLKKMFQILNVDSRDFILEYEFLKLTDFFELFSFLFIYPFKILQLIQKENNIDDKIFNYSLIYDIRYFSFESITRYILGKKISKISSIQKIYSWSEFQVIERSFNYAIRKHNSKIQILALQFYLNYETYFNSYIDDLDYVMQSSPHVVLVNGSYYVQDREKLTYDTGVSLRYQDLFTFIGINSEDNILVLGSYIEDDTKYMLEGVDNLEKVIFKNHPAVNIDKLGTIPLNIIVSTQNIYKLFEQVKLVIGTASGTSVEAIACGVSVIIIASQDNLTANPLVEYGKGKIWDIAFSKDDVEKVYNNLIGYRKNNMLEIEEIATYYKDNFFIEPTEAKIIKLFELDKKRN